MIQIKTGLETVTSLELTINTMKRAGTHIFDKQEILPDNIVCYFTLRAEGK